MWKYLIVLLLLVLNGAALIAQPEATDEKSRFARIKEAKEAFLREQLPLTEQEAAVFFPVYWEYDTKLRQYRHGGHGRSSQHTDNLTDEEALALLIKLRERRARMVQLHTEAELAYLEILPATKVIRLERVEREFRKKLLGHLRKGRKNKR